MNIMKYTPFLFAAYAAFVFAACQPTSNGGSVNTAVTVDETAGEVVDVVNDLFQAMEARDSVRLKMALHPNALFTSVDLTGERPATRRTEGTAFISSVGQPGVPYVERMYDPVVEHHGDFAQLWAYYDFSLGDSLSHCGHDAIQLVREGGQWRILSITYTRTGCE